MIGTNLSKWPVLVALVTVLTACSKQESNLDVQASAVDNSEKTAAINLKAVDLKKTETHVEEVLKQDPDFVQQLLASSVSSQSDMFNREAVIPPQCYTKTEGHFNPCYTCHQFTPRNQGRANRMGDGELQGDYGFSDLGTTNHWLNLFEDRTERMAKISDAEIDEYVNYDNYSSLADRLMAQGWDAWYPDLKNLQLSEAAFDDQGFAKDGSGWVAFNYMPLPSTFWPTNGATDDVMIRLAENFQKNQQGEFDRDIYLLNLTIVEAAIKNFTELTIPEIDENTVGFDLNGDGRLSKTTTLKRPSNYLGGASDVQVKSFLYPRYTEFLHTIRYVGVRENGEIYTPPRMKEVRYMVKTEEHRKSTLGAFYAEEQKDKLEGNLPRYASLGEKGLDNKFGWQLIGFIEDKNGELRQQKFEENFFCMGCHTTIGSTIDQTFAFARKIDGAKGWGYLNLKGMPNVPMFGSDKSANFDYLERVGGGNEFRENEEIDARYFKHGQLDESSLAAVRDVYELITPSPERARALNKAYKTIVDDQDYIYGRDANIKPAVNVYRSIDTEIEPLEPEYRAAFDIRLDWSSVTGDNSNSPKVESRP